jgi:hypothetical protein
MDASERSDLELLGQQLSAWQSTAGLRHPLLEMPTRSDFRPVCMAIISICISPTVRQCGSNKTPATASAASAAGSAAA